MITLNVTVDSNDVIKKLNRIKENSNQSLSPIVNQMSKDTKNVASNGIPINFGSLLSSLKIANIVNVDNHYKNMIYTNMPYAKFVHDGTRGEWWTHESDQRLVVAKLDKYSLEYKNGFYKFHGQKPKPFMKNAFLSTLNSNKSLAKSMYREYILKGTR